MYAREAARLRRIDRHRQIHGLHALIAFMLIPRVLGM